MVVRHRIRHTKETNVEISNIKQMMEMELMVGLLVEEEEKKVIKLLGMK